MATQVLVEEEITLQNGSKVVVRPLNIKRLRKFMTVMGKMGEPVLDEDGKEKVLTATEEQMHQMDLTMEAVAVCLEGVDAELAADRDKLEDVLDSNIIKNILRVAAGVEEGPNLRDLTG